ncbi:MAG: ABC transporter permease [Gallionella sp.]|nr:ABC transporter permease [Gallionella sp.]
MRSIPLAFLDTCHSFNGYLKLLVYAARNANSLRLRPVRTVFNRQVYFTAIEALKTTALLALLCGALVATQITALTGNNSELVVNILAWTIVRELGPLVTAIIIIARSSAAIASELALMRIHGEIQSIGFMGIPHNSYLLVPRIFGVALSVAALNIYFQVIAIGGGLFISSIFQHISFWEHLNKFFDIIRLLDFFLSLIKGVLYGVVISASACYHGMNVSHSITEVPKATTRAVTHGILAIFLFDAIFAYVNFLVY